MALYERLLGRDESGERVPGKIPAHAFQATLAEFARGKLSIAEANAIIETVSGDPLSAAELGEVQALLGTFSGNPAAKLARAKEIDDVLLLADANAPGYERPSQITARLGV